MKIKVLLNGQNFLSIILRNIKNKNKKVEILIIIQYCRIYLCIMTILSKLKNILYIKKKRKKKPV